MFLEQGVKQENKFWKYLVGSALIILASFIGQLPFLGVVLFETFSNNRKYPENNKELMGFLEPNLSLFFMLISFVFAIVAIGFVVKYLHNQSWISVISSRKKIDWQRVWFSFLIWTAFTVTSTLFAYWSNPDQMLLNFELLPFLILVVIGVILIPVQTSTEELVFRGYLMQGFANLAQNKWFPLLMTSLVFGGMHFANPEVAQMGNIIYVYYIGTGLFLGIITLMDEGMELALGFHAANNIAGALLVTSEWSAFQTHSVFKDISNPDAGADVIVPVVIVFPVLLFIFSRRYQWKNWRSRLLGPINNG